MTDYEVQQIQCVCSLCPCAEEHLTRTVTVKNFNFTRSMLFTYFDVTLRPYEKLCSRCLNILEAVRSFVQNFWLIDSSLTVNITNVHLNGPQEFVEDFIPTLSLHAEDCALPPKIAVKQNIHISTTKIKKEKTILSTPAHTQSSPSHNNGAKPMGNLELQLKNNVDISFKSDKTVLFANAISVVEDTNWLKFECDELLTPKDHLKMDQHFYISIQIRNKSFFRNSSHLKAQRKFGSKAKSIVNMTNSLPPNAPISLQEPLTTQSGENLYVCSFCSRTFNNNDQHQMHLANHLKEKPYICTICKKSFRRNSDLKSHVIVHSNVKPYLCSICSKSFSRRNIFDNHLRMHSGERPFTCTVCNKSFRQSGGLSSHVRIHTKEKRFMCIVCRKTFFRRTELIAHAGVHSDARPFSCTVCDKSFKRSAHLREHLSTHLTKKPHICTICDRSFCVKRQLKLHLKIHSGEKLQV